MIFTGLAGQVWAVDGMPNAKLAITADANANALNFMVSLPKELFFLIVRQTNTPHPEERTKCAGRM
jgi:hypothetical protein